MQILIVDDHEMIRCGVRQLLSSSPACTICGEASSGEEAIAQARALHPHLILLDISMSDSNGLEVAAKLRREIPTMKIIIMSHYEKAQLLPRALEAGADACVDKDRLSTDLLPTIAAMA
jgi:DNA-binding NarL/FixJ family response regulator